MGLNNDLKKFLPRFMQGAASPTEQKIDFGDSINPSSNAGLGAGTFTASLSLDGTIYPLSITLVGGETYSDIVTLLNSQTTDTEDFRITGGNIIIKSPTTGSASIVALSDVNIFSGMTGFVAVDSPVAGKSTPMNELMDVVGEMFDGFEVYIDGMKEYTDPLKLDEDRLEQLAQQMDIKFPRNMSLNRRREYVSEAVDIYRSNGTMRSLLRSFKLIGWDVDVFEVFIVEPSYYDTEVFLTVSNDSGESVELYKYDKIFGKEVLNGQEVVVDLEDAGGAKYPGRPIYGQKYAGSVSTPAFVKVPYIKIKINTEDYDFLTQDYVVGGVTYSYTDSEDFQILEEIKNHFLTVARPAHVALLEVAAGFGFTGGNADSFYMALSDPTFTISTENVGAKYDGTLAYGISTDRYILGETMGGFQYGNTVMNYYGVDEDAPNDSYSRSYAIGSIGLQDYLPTREHSTITITVPSDATVDILGYTGRRDLILAGSVGSTVITTETNVSAKVIEIHNWFFIRINVTSSSALGAITVDVVNN